MSAAVTISLPATAPALVDLRDVTKSYGDGDSEVRALSGTSLRIGDGDLVAIMGASGSGKSTTLNILGTLDVPTTGQYLFRGVDVGTLDRDSLARLRRHYLGFVFQGFHLLPRTSAVENVELPLVYRRVKAKERRERALQALADVGLSDRVHHNPAELSGGQQQRVAIARAIVTDPEMLLADEPTGNLDSRRSHDIMRLLVDLNERRKITVVMVTHEAEMADYTRRIIHFKDGSIEQDERRSAR